MRDDPVETRVPGAEYCKKCDEYSVFEHVHANKIVKATGEMIRVLQCNICGKKWGRVT